MRQNSNKSAGNFAFIDNQNLNLGIQKMGWKMDWRKFRAFLKNSYGVEQAFMFIGYMPEYEGLYEQMHDSGYLVVLKPTLEMFKTLPKKEETAETSQAGGPQEKNDQGNEAYKTYGEQAAEDTPQQPPAAAQRPVKGNVDAELVLYAVKEMPNYQKAIIISGDGDFYSLVEYLKEKDKLLHLMVPNWQYSSLLKPFDSYILRLDQRRRQLAYHPRKTS
jgi:uncharacterized LabA/DUF88 family protein